MNRLKYSWRFTRFSSANNLLRRVSARVVAPCIVCCTVSRTHMCRAAISRPINLVDAGDERTKSDPLTSAQHTDNISRVAGTQKFEMNYMLRLD